MLLNKAIEEQYLLSKRRRIPAKQNPNSSLVWAIEVEKTHSDRLYSLLRSVCDESISILRILESTTGTFSNVSERTHSIKSRLQNMPSIACSSLIYSNINMVTSTNLPSEAFRSVHRMFFVPHTCNDPTNILQHAEFLHLFTSMRNSKHHIDAIGGGHVAAEKREHEKDESNEYGNIEKNVILKIQTSPKSLEKFLFEMITSRIPLTHLKYGNFAILESEEHSVKIKKSYGMKSKNSKKSYSESGGDKEAEEVEYEEVSNSRAKNHNYSCDKTGNIEKKDVLGQKFTHLLQCIYGVDDGVFRWGLVSTDESVRYRLLSVSLDEDIENDRLQRFERDTVLYERNNNKNTENRDNSNSDDINDNDNENKKYKNITIENQESRSDHTTENQKISFFPASRAYYKMSEIKEFYFPLWGWVWPGCSPHDVKRQRQNNESEMKFKNENGIGNVNEILNEIDNELVNDVDETHDISKIPHTASHTAPQPLLQCNAVDVGASPGGWTQCLAAHCHRVISLDPGKLRLLSSHLSATVLSFSLLLLFFYLSFFIFIPIYFEYFFVLHLNTGDLAPNVINLRNVRHVRTLVQTEDAQLAMQSVAERSVFSNPYNENNSVDDNDHNDNSDNLYDDCNNNDNDNDNDNSISNNDSDDDAKTKNLRGTYNNHLYSLGLRVVVCDVNAAPVAAATLLSSYVLPHMVRACQCYCGSDDKDIKDRREEKGEGDENNEKDGMECTCGGFVVLTLKLVKNAKENYIENSILKVSEILKNSGCYDFHVVHLGANSKNERTLVCRIGTNNVVKIKNDGKWLFLAMMT